MAEEFIVLENKNEFNNIVVVDWILKWLRGADPKRYATQVITD